MYFLISSWQRQEAGGTWTSAGEGTVRSGTLVLANVRPHHTGRYACSVGAESSPRVLTRLVVYEPLTVAVAPNPLVRLRGYY